MKTFDPSSRNKIKRVPKRGYYDEATINSVLDASFIAHVGFVVNGQPFVIPTAYGREGNQLYFHGATKSRLMQEMDKGIPVCLTVTLLDGIVLARSAFHHSMNYRSVVVFGQARKIEGEEKDKALYVISEQILPGRWDEAREPNEKELKATTVLALTIEEASAKIRTGPPSDDKPDYDLPIWAGVLPLQSGYLPPIPDPDMKQDLPIPPSVLAVKHQK